MNFPVSRKIEGTEFTVEFTKITADKLSKVYRQMIGAFTKAVSLASENHDPESKEFETAFAGALVDTLDDSGKYDTIRQLFMEHAIIPGTGEVWENREKILEKSLSFDLTFFLTGVHVYLGEHLQAADAKGNTK
jgi:hypothetical protein